MTADQSHWRKVIRNEKFRRHFIFTFFLLIACAIAAPYLFNYVEKRDGIILIDPLLELLPSHDLSAFTFTLLYILIGVCIFNLIQFPEKLLLGLWSYLILTLMRFITLLIVPLNPPPGLIELQDPFVQHLFYQQSITKDLFFSGHTALIALFTMLLSHKPLLQKVLAGCTLLIGLLLLYQHAHYTIDVLAAPVFAWASYKLASIIRSPK